MDYTNTPQVHQNPSSFGGLIFVIFLLIFLSAIIIYFETKSKHKNK